MFYVPKITSLVAVENSKKKKMKETVKNHMALQ